MATPGSRMRHGTHTARALAIRMVPHPPYAQLFRRPHRPGIARPHALSRARFSISSSCTSKYPPCRLRGDGRSWDYVLAAHTATSLPRRRRPSAVRSVRGSHRALAGTHWAVLDGIGRVARAYGAWTRSLQARDSAARADSSRCRVSTLLRKIFLPRLQALVAPFVQSPSPRVVLGEVGSASCVARSDS
ncbi:hypothetical protein C8R45DRAFT_508264 [Mycena sanguinolenta]|nr:hypothetical protein C8R45DRAFT_508264 [Mycena sanguinolenta]